MTLSYLVTILAIFSWLPLVSFVSWDPWETGWSRGTCRAVWANILKGDQDMFVKKWSVKAKVFNYQRRLKRRFTFRLRSERSAAFPWETVKNEKTGLEAPRFTKQHRKSEHYMAKSMLTAATDMQHSDSLAITLLLHQPLLIWIGTESATRAPVMSNTDDEDLFTVPDFQFTSEV